MKSTILNILVIGSCLLYLLSCTSKTETATRNKIEQETENVTADSIHSEHQGFIYYSKKAKVGETVYIPVYSHIYQQSAKRTFNLTATLSIRNTDLNYPITLSKVNYYDSNGDLVQKYLDTPKKINPLSSISFVVEEEDLRGGVGANYLVLWESEHLVTSPIIEAVMISTAQSQGVSFTSEGRTIHSLK